MEINSGVARELPCHRLVVCAWEQSLQITKLKLLNCTNYNKLSVDRAVKVFFIIKATHNAQCDSKNHNRLLRKALIIQHVPSKSGEFGRVPSLENLQYSLEFQV